MARNEISDHHKDQLLDTLMYYLPMELRGLLMREVPAAYNAYCERTIAKVVRTSDGTPIRAQGKRFHVGDRDVCTRCRFAWDEHSEDGVCPDDEDHARCNREEKAVAA